MGQSARRYLGLWLKIQLLFVVVALFFFVGGHWSVYPRLTSKRPSTVADQCHRPGPTSANLSILRNLLCNSRPGYVASSILAAYVCARHFCRSTDCSSSGMLVSTSLSV